MTEHTVKHHTFTIERTYPATVARVFEAWSDPKAKARWFAGEGNEHELDFTVGGVEVNRAAKPGGGTMVFESRYQDIVDRERIVYSSTLSGDGVLSTVSLTTVQLYPDGDSTRLVLVEQDTFLDDQEQPSWREHGTSSWLDALGDDLRAVTAS
jgi:uncharacterized protein YndB with AHSA1/START domain